MLAATRAYYVTPLLTSYQPLSSFFMPHLTQSMHIKTLTCVRICTYFAYRTTNSGTFINLSDRTGTLLYECTQTGMALTVEAIPTFVLSSI